MRLLVAATWILMMVGATLGDAARARADETLRVMTFNVRYGSANDGENSWPRRRELLLETIRKFDPDLLGTQEVLAAQADYLAEHLEGYTLVGVGRDDGKRQGEFSAVLFKTARFEATASGTFWLSETPEVAGSKSWDSSLPRIVTWVKLRDRAAGDRQICFLNTHWDHIGRQARAESGQIIRRWIDAHAEGMSVILTGDLNVNDTHEGFAALVAADGRPRLVDVYRQTHPEADAEERTAHGFSGRRQGRRIDFILASSDWQASEAAIDHTARDGRYPSDHFPVTAVLRPANR